MKTKILLLIITLSFSFNSYSQQIDRFITNDTVEIRKLGDSIISIAKRDFVFTRSKLLTNYGIYSLKYIEVTNRDEKAEIVVNHKIEYIGSNSALEIKGTPQYRLTEITGLFLDIFPFWKKYIDVNANIESLSKGNDYQHEKMTVVFKNGLTGYYKLSRISPNVNEWRIRFIETQSNVGNKL